VFMIWLQQQRECRGSLFSLGVARKAKSSGSDSFQQFGNIGVKLLVVLLADLRAMKNTRSLKSSDVCRFVYIIWLSQELRPY